VPHEIHEKVTGFVEGTLTDSLDYINPYMAWDLRVYVEYSKVNFTGTIEVDGFYTQNFDAWMVHPIPDTNGMTANHINADDLYNSLGGYNPVQTDYPFLVRFSPPIVGDWTAKVKIVAPGMYYESEKFKFTVVESDNPGYVTKDASNRFFKLGANYFRPLGANILWPMSHNDVSNNPGLNTKKVTDILSHGFDLVLSEDFRQVNPIPIIFDNYRNHIRNIADGGGNFVRLLMHGFSQDIEWEKLGDYTNRLYIAQEMDKTLEYCESRGIYIDWNFQYQGVFNPAYKASWKNEYLGNTYCYKTLIKNKFPAQANDPDFVNNTTVFFTDPDIKRYYKQRLRYLVSRYGYSTNIAIFELFSEVNKNSFFNANEAPNTPEQDLILTLWHSEMAAFIKSMHNGITHMVQTSNIGPVSHNDLSFRNPSIDNVATNIYPGSKTFAKKWIDQIQKDFLNQDGDAEHKGLMSYCDNSDNCNHIIKPYFMSEYDPSGEIGIPGLRDFQELCDDQQIEGKRAMWQIPFSGAAGGTTWNTYHNGIVYQEYANIKRFTDHMNQVGGWHPGAVEVLADGRLKYHSNWAQDMDHEMSNDNDENSKVDLMYLRSADKNYAFGVITNKTYNVESVAGCMYDSLYQENRMPNFDSLTEPSQVGLMNTEDWNLKLHGLNEDKYYITYFFPNAQDEPFKSDEAFGPNIKLKVKVPASYNRFVVLFMARRRDHPWKAIALNDSLTINSQEDNFRLFDENEQIDELTYFEIKVYPIPTSDKVIIEQFSNENQIEIQILSMDGKLIKTEKLSHAKKEIDLSLFEKGVYLLKFFKEGTLIKQTKIIKL